MILSPFSFDSIVPKSMKIIGHRGAAGLAPEKHLKAPLRTALRYRVDEIEVDVRVTKDDVPV